MPSRRNNSSSEKRLFRQEEIRKRSAYTPLPEAYAYSEDLEKGSKVRDTRRKVIGVLVRKMGFEPLMLNIPVDRTDPMPNQPRQDKKGPTKAEIESKTRRLLPIVTVLYYNYERREIRHLIVSGERSWRRAQAQGHENIFGSVMWEPSTDELFDLAAVANQDVEPMNPIEAATTYRRMIDRVLAERKGSGKRDENRAIEAVVEKIPSLTAKEIKELLGLLKLDPKIQALIRQLRIGKSNASRLAARDLLTKDIHAKLADKLAEAARGLKPGERIPSRDIDRIIRQVQAGAAKKIMGGPRRYAAPDKLVLEGDSLLVALANTTVHADTLLEEMEGGRNLNGDFEGVLADDIREAMDAINTLLIALKDEKEAFKPSDIKTILRHLRRLRGGLQNTLIVMQSDIVRACLERLLRKIEKPG